MATSIPLRENILANIKTTLQTITPSATGTSYRTKPNKVSRVFSHFSKLSDSDFPALFVIDTGAETIHTTSFNVIEEKMNAVVVGYVKWNEFGVENDIASVQINNLYSDVMEVLMVDLQRGTNSDGDDNAITTEMTDLIISQGEIEPYAAFEMTVQIELNYLATNTGEAHHS